MYKKRSLVVALAILSLVAGGGLIFAGGGQSGGAAEKDVLTIMVMAGSTPPWEKGMELWTLQQTGKVADVNIEIIPIPRDVYEVKFNTTLSSGDMPDLIQPNSVSSSEVTWSYGNAGKLLAVNKYLNQLPNLSGYLRQDTWMDQISLLADPDSENLYIFPDVRDPESGRSNLGLIGRIDWLKAEGIDPLNIGSVDELLDAFRVMQKKIGGPIYGSRYGFAALGHLSQIFGIGWGRVFYDPALGEYSSMFLQSDKAKDFLRFIRVMVDEGMCDPDFLTMPDQEWDGLVKEGKYALIQHDARWVTHLNMAAVNYAETENPWGFIMPPPYKGKVQSWSKRGNRVVYGGWIPNANPKCPLDKMLKTVDWLGYTKEAQFIWLYGKEGVTYKLVDGLPKFLGDPNDKGEFEELARNQHGITHNFSTLVDDYWGQLTAFPNYIPYTGEQRSLWWKHVPLHFDPLTTFSSEEQEKQSELGGAIDTAMNEWGAKFFLGEVGVDDFADLIAQVKKMGLQQLVDIYNSGVKRFESQKINYF